MKVAIKSSFYFSIVLILIYCQFTFQLNFDTTIVKSKLLSKNKLELNSEESAGLVRLARLVLGQEKTAYLGTLCKEKNVCRTALESIVILYDRAKKINRLMSYESCRSKDKNGKLNLFSTSCRDDLKSDIGNKSIFVLDKRIKFSQEDVNKFLIGVTPYDMTSPKSTIIKETILVKICIPIDKSKMYYIDFKCPFDDCDPEYNNNFSICKVKTNLKGKSTGLNIHAKKF